jgi:hypothetical protein
MEDQDWLDRRLTADNYIPDEGFTARVMERLPVKQPQAVVLRQRILAASAFVAACLIALQIVPLFHTFEHLAAHHPITGLFLGLATLIQQPLILVAAAAGMTFVAVASIPLLRRWA